MIGKTLGRYRILEAIGEGGMGRVYLAEDPALKRKVAVKILPPEAASSKERRKRLLHEAQAASGLNHPNIVTIYDLGEDDGAPYVAMELVDGVSLTEWVAAEERSVRDMLAIVRQATGALAQAHAAGLVHRDLKPDNLMVRRDGLLKILDFGLVRSVSPETAGPTATLPGSIMGSPPYMSPEQVLGQPAGTESDVFSLGTVLYELLTGAHPFTARSIVETMHRILHESPEPPSKIKPHLPSDVDFVVMKALSKEAERRYTSARELDVDLETCESRLSGAPAAVPQSSSAPRTLAVLPFKNIGGDPEFNYLGVGLADAVITRLASSPDLVLRTTSSIAGYANQAVDPRRVAHELEVGTILDASFQRAGDRFRATARLVELPAGRALWAGKVDVRFEDIFDVQDQVAHGIAEVLKARLEGGETAETQKHAPAPEAYEALLRAQEVFRTGTRSGFDRAAELGEEAVQKDPGFADAWALLGSVYHGYVDGGFEADPKWYAKAEEALQRALGIDPRHANALFSMGALHLVRGRKREAYRTFVESHHRLPNVWVVYHYFGYLFRLCDMLDEALQAELKAHETDPSVPWPYWGCGRLHIHRGELDHAREWFNRAQARFATHGRVVSMEIWLLLDEGRYEEALELIERRRPGIEDTGASTFQRAFCLLKLSREPEARADLEMFRRFAEVDMDWAAYYAGLRGLQGDSEEAFRSLEHATSLGNDAQALYEDEALFGPLHQDPRWGSFIEGVRGRVTQWKREFFWPPK
ncbi:MAG: protein kinase [Candidatus Eisenbacteria bacterium]|nr:protein kinase [Candidatus Eisenbacteria bacterium]